MDFEDIESEFANLFSIVHTHRRENRFFQDTQHRSRKSPRKKLKAARASAALVIDQLKSGFRRPGDFTPRMRTRRNCVWRPELLIKYFRDNRRDFNERSAVVMQHGKSRQRSFVPDAPKIYSIGLRCGARSFSDSDDLSSFCSVIRNFKKRFSIVRRLIICKNIAQSTSASSLSTDVSLETHTNRQTMIIDCTELTDIPKHDWTQKHNHSQHNQHIEGKDNGDISDSLRDKHAAGDRSFPSDDSKDSPAKEDHKHDRFHVIRKDAQSQTSSRKSSRRKKAKGKSKPTNEEISHRKRCDDKPHGGFIANSRVDSHNSDRKNHKRLSGASAARVLENKRAEYINKFTAVNRQIEEITATLRETCRDDENSRSNLENRENCSPSILDKAKVDTMQELNDVENEHRIARRKNVSVETNSVNVKNIIKKAENNRHKNVQRILHSDNINNETLGKKFSKDTLASSINANRNLNDIFAHNSIRGFAIKGTIYPSNRVCTDRKKAKPRFVQPISLDLDLTKDELQEFSTDDESFDEGRLRNNFVAPSDDTNAKNLIKHFADLKESKYRKKIAEEKTGEMAILEDIKRRIDRDFDDLSAGRSENDTEDFFTVSQSSSNNLDNQFYGIAPVKNMATDDREIIEESWSAPSIVSVNLDSIEMEIRDSISTGAVSEYSNKNSALSKYFSCTHFSSLISSTEDKDEFALGIENRNTAARDSHSNTHLYSDYYDLDFGSNVDYSRSGLSVNDCSRSNLDSSFDRSLFISENAAPSDTSTRCVSPNQFLIETMDAPNDTFEMSEGGEDFVENTICEREHLRRKDEREESRRAADSTFETSKSSRCIGSIDSGVFSSSLIDLCLRESSFDASKSQLKENRRVEKLGGSPPTLDFSSDSTGCTDDTLDRRVDDIVRDLTKNLVLCERRARIKLTEMRKAGFGMKSARYFPRTLSRACKFSSRLCDFFNSPRQSSENESISISTPSLLSLSDSEIEDRELRCQL